MVPPWSALQPHNRLVVPTHIRVAGNLSVLIPEMKDCLWIVRELGRLLTCNWHEILLADGKSYYFSRNNTIFTMDERICVFAVCIWQQSELQDCATWFRLLQYYQRGNADEWYVFIGYYQVHRVFTPFWRHYLLGATLEAPGIVKRNNVGIQWYTCKNNGTKWLT